MACSVETAQEHRKGGKTDYNQQPDIESNPYPMRTLYTDGSDAKNTQKSHPYHFLLTIWTYPSSRRLNCTG